MLSQAKNELLTRIGPGTPMGELMRRYWQPIAAVAELDDNPVKPVRLMGEDLVLYKDLGGHYGLVQRRCGANCGWLLHSNFGFIANDKQNSPEDCIHRRREAAADVCSGGSTRSWAVIKLRISLSWSSAAQSEIADAHAKELRQRPSAQRT